LISAIGQIAVTRSASAGGTGGAAALSDRHQHAAHEGRQRVEQRLEAPTGHHLQRAAHMIGA
jgi:hypothetical protein